MQFERTERCHLLILLGEIFAKGVLDGAGGCAINICQYVYEAFLHKLCKDIRFVSCSSKKYFVRLPPPPPHRQPATTTNSDQVQALEECKPLGLLLLPGRVY